MSLNAHGHDLLLRRAELRDQVADHHPQQIAVVACWQVMMPAIKTLRSIDVPFGGRLVDCHRPDFVQSDYQEEAPDLFSLWYFVLTINDPPKESPEHGLNNIVRFNPLRKPFSDLTTRKSPQSVSVPLVQIGRRIRLPGAHTP